MCNLQREVGKIDEPENQTENSIELLSKRKHTLQESKTKEMRVTFKKMSIWKIRGKKWEKMTSENMRRITETTNLPEAFRRQNYTKNKKSFSQQFGSKRNNASAFSENELIRASTIRLRFQKRRNIFNHEWAQLWNLP